MKEHESCLPLHWSIQHYVLYRGANLEARTHYLESFILLVVNGYYFSRIDVYYEVMRSDCSSWNGLLYREVAFVDWGVASVDRGGAFCILERRLCG